MDKKYAAHEKATRVATRAYSEEFERQSKKTAKLMFERMTSVSAITPFPGEPVSTFSERLRDTVLDMRDVAMRHGGASTLQDMGSLEDYIKKNLQDFL